MSETCDRRWGDPGYQVPTRWWHGKRGASQGRFDHGAKLEHLIQHMHSIHGGRFGVIPSKRAIGAERVWYDVEEVDVLIAVVEEVVVHVSSWEVVVHMP